MCKSLKTNNKEEDEQLALLQSIICTQFYFVVGRYSVTDAPRNYNGLRALKQTFVAKMRHLISKKIW